MTARGVRAEDPWAEAAGRVRGEVTRSPYTALLAGAALGALLAGDFARRALPSLLGVAARAFLASALRGT